MPKRRGTPRERAERALDREFHRKRYENERRRNPLAAPGPLPLVIVLDGLKAGFNVAKIFRSALAFGVREIHLVDIGPFNPAPAKGAFRKVPARFHSAFDSAYRVLSADGYTLFALDPAAPVSLAASELPDKTAFVLGHEELGLSFDSAAYPALCRLAIPQSGPVQSLNVAVAASIAMYEYRRRREPRAR